MPGGDAPRRLTLVKHEHLQDATYLRRRAATDPVQTLRHHHRVETAADAGDLTDVTAFDWLRWVAHVKVARDVIQDDVDIVYANRCCGTPCHGS